ncbi:flagellar hook-basal body complex protein [Limnohabitans sp. 2KL-27]|uniref:flagellar hook-basal body complex protein n=1 Tax=Limnohabitans sp. 2KL-27 TaxID=1100705 RepID=UPI000B01A3F8|nr:flagellar hook-basal body complex protein [Limnohabitans sp. 2KL-27]
MSFYTSLTGLNSATAQLAVTSNNIANVGTSGFKRSRADFGDIFSTSPLQKSSSNIGQGVSLKQVSQEFSQGNISTSGNSLDLAITGDGFFPLKTPDGLQDTYTRNGSFTLNDQNNVVNSTGQRLMAASVDSSGKADLTNLNALTIPSKTSGEAVETTKIQLGLNLPADSAVITADFDRTNPSTYNKSTALTVYDSGGNGYLATVYYVKTQNATLDSPYSKWQTYFFVGESEVKPALQQATDNLGSNYFVNKYGDVLPKSDSRVVPSSGTTEMYSLDQLTDLRASSPAKAVGSALTEDVYTSGAYVTVPSGSVSFSITVDGQETATAITYTLQDMDVDPQVLARNLEIKINNVLGALEDTEATDDADAVVNARYGITVEFDTDTAKFSIASGTTGDDSSITISGADTQAETLLGLAESDNLTVAASTTDALRGKASEPAVLRGEIMTINTAKSIQVTSSNKDFFVSVDGIVQQIELPYPTTYTSIDSFTAALQDLINSIEDEENNMPVNVSGVTVAFDTQTKQLVFTTGTTGSDSAIQVTGSADWGLEDTEMQFGTTTEWVKLAQFTENGALQYVNNGVQTEDATGLSDKTEWWPVYLDRGELSFDLTGKPVSPLTDMPFETAFLQGGKGALTMSIDFTKSTQYSSAFAVLSQSQDGAPEGELMGLNIGPDGLVNATYSNGSQVSLGKIVLANFSSPSGLRQVGDASYLASASSGAAKIGEAGSAGFGSIRAGATERANVDLTQELVDLITAQRNFQANAKAIETSSTMTSAIINIRS